MALPSRSIILKRSREGFTFIEVTIAMAIMVSLIGIGLPAGWGFYQTYQFNAEVNVLASLLEQARSAAMANRNESSHGVYLGAAAFILFQGSTYATRNTALDRSFPRNSIIAIAGPTELTFTPLSGQPSASTTYAFTAGQKAWSININSQGAISY